MLEVLYNRDVFLQIVNHSKYAQSRFKSKDNRDVFRYEHANCCTRDICDGIDDKGSRVEDPSPVSLVGRDGAQLLEGS